MTATDTSKSDTWHYINDVLKPLLADRSASQVLGAAGKSYAADWSETKMECEILQLYRSLVSPNGSVRDYALSAVL